MRCSWSSAFLVSIPSVAVAGALVLYHFDPSSAGFYPPCLFHSLTGLQCPGCGTTRALHHLLHGDVAGAFRLNAMLFVVAPFATLATASRRIRMHRYAGWGALAVTVVWWIVRNV